MFFAVVILIVLLAAALVWVGNYFYNFALNPRTDGGFSQAAGIVDNAYTRWLLARGEDRTLNSRDGLSLHAYQVSQPEGSRYVILCHGYQNNATAMASYARHFYDLGDTVLLPDARGHGQSEGNYIGMGWHERLDILDWVDALIQEDPQAQIALFGVSMGAATVMMVSGETLPEQVKCIVEDCGYTSAWDEFSGQLRQLYGLPPFPVLTVTNLVTKVRAGYFLTEASAIKQVAKSSTPTLFIHGSADTFVPFSMLDQVYEAASCEKEKLVVEGAAHANSAQTDPELYWTTVDTFLDRHMEQ